MLKPAIDASPVEQAAHAIARAVESLQRTVTPEGLSATDAAAFIGVSVSQLYDLDTRGLMPEGVVIGDGRCRRWLRGELLAWLEAGAPTRTRWNIIRPKRKSA